MRDEPGLDLACGSGGLLLDPPPMAQKILIFLFRGETNPENIRWQDCKDGERNRDKQELPDEFEHRDREDIEADRASKTRKNVFRVDSRPSGNASLVAMRMFAAGR